jgi:ABC-2 type transport system ATP-binding protein
MIQGIRAGGMTVVLTTHYMEEAEVLRDRVAVMDRGRVIACDTPGALIASLGIEATVRARITGGSLNLPELEALPAVLGASIEGDRIALQTRDVQSTLIALLRLVEAQGVTLAEMTSQQSTLEDVFLSLTGRTYDDTANEPAPEAEAAVERRRRR